MNRQIFKNIKIDLVLENVYRRLGFWDKATVIKDNQRADIDKMIYETLDYLNFSAVAVRVKVLKNDGEAITIDNGTKYDSKNLASVFKDADELLFMGATAGQLIMTKVDELSKSDLTKATIYNAVAGEMVDDVFDWLMAYYSRSLRRDMKTVSRNRYSAGYGDLSIQKQRDIFELLELDELGVSITSSYMLKPEKSVTAIAGIK